MRKKERLYMVVTADKLELPLFVSDDIQEVAEKFGITAATARSYCSPNRHDGSRSGVRYIRVCFDKNDLN